MKHPEPAELIHMRKGELPSERTAEVTAHIQECEACRMEWEKLEILENRLAGWQNKTVSESFVTRTLEMAETEGLISNRASERYPTGGGTIRLWIRRAGLAAVAVAASLIFQAMIWSPFDAQTRFRAILDLVPAAAALPAGQAVPDTVLVLTLHPDEKLSAPMLTGQYSVEEITEKLLERLRKGQFKKVLVIGADRESQVTIRTKDLQPLIDGLEIGSVTYGEGVVALEVLNDFTVRAAVPIRLRRTVDLKLKPVVITDTTRSILLSADTLLFSRADSLVLTRAEPIVVEMINRRLQVKPHIHIKPVHVDVEVVLAVEPVAALLDSLKSPVRAILTVSPDGTVLMNRAALPMKDIRAVLKRLRDQNPDITILIIVSEEKGKEDEGYLLADIAREVGIETIIIKKVKDR